MAVLTLAVVAEGHLSLAKTNSVLAGADAIELLELGLLNILQGLLSVPSLSLSCVVRICEADVHAPQHSDVGQGRGKGGRTWLGK
jgi:hypothetical protein